MSEVRTDALSERYAESLQELVAAQGGDFAAVCESLDGVLELAANESSLAEFLRSPIIDPKKRDASFGPHADGPSGTGHPELLAIAEQQGTPCRPARHRGSRQSFVRMPPPVAFE